jgi:phosphate transport system permease protein
MAYIYFSGMIILVVLGFMLGRARALSAGQAQVIHSRPVYHGAHVVSWVLLPMMAVFAAGVPIAHWFTETQSLAALDSSIVNDAFKRAVALRDIQLIAGGRMAESPTPELRQAAETYASLRSLTEILILGGGLVLGLLGAAWALHSLSANFRARNAVERVVLVVMICCASVAVLTTVGILFSVLFETLRFFQQVSPIEFIFGTHWSPQTAIRADQAGSSGAFGIVPLVTGTLLITAIAMLVAGPIGLFAAIYLAEYASPRFRAFAKPILEILAGIPTVVLGFFAALSLAPLVRESGQALGMNVASESALAAGLVMGMMIVPFVSSLSDDVINAVPQSLRDGSYAMGATKSETIKKVVLPAAFAGIVSAFMLAISRAVGETMIVVMAAGLAGNLTFNPLDAVTTFTVQIKTILVGDQEFDSAKTLSAFALGFVLFFFTLTLNVIAMQVVKRYREQYD